MKYKYILFDLDGTLTDSYDGIAKSFQYALNEFGIKEELSNLKKVAGPPLIDSFCDFYNFDYETGVKAVEKFRERYSKIGWKENRLIDGVEDMLRRLEKTDKVLAVATSKPLFYAEKIIEMFGIDKYFKAVCGDDLDVKVSKAVASTKTQAIERAISLLGNPEKSSVLMVGDRKYDAIGAAEAGVDCVCVRSGYEEEGELEAVKLLNIFDTVSSLAEFLISE